MFSLLLLLFPASRDFDMAGKLVPGIGECRPLQPKIAAEDFGKLDRAMGFPVEPYFRGSRVYAASAGEASVRETFWIVFVPALGGDLALAVNQENRIHALSWFAQESPSKPHSSWDSYLGSFRGKDLARFTASLELPIADFRKKLEQAQRGDALQDESARRVQTLLRQKVLMEDIEHSYLSLSDRLEAGESKELQAGFDDLLRSFERLTSNAPALAGVLEEKAIVRYKKSAEESRSVATQAQMAFQKGNRANAKRLLDEDFQDSCSRCHGWDGHSLRKPLQRAMRTLREELGVGDGFFQIGFDAPQAPPEKAKDAERMLAALRGALLLISRSR